MTNETRFHDKHLDMVAERDALAERVRVLEAVIKDAPDLWAFDGDELEQRSEFDKRWYARVRAALRGGK